MITVHHLENSRSQRILWLLEELQLPYEVKRYQRNSKTMLAPPELKAVHPLGKSPVITDGDVTVAESGLIIDYLIDHYGQGQLKPAADTPERLRYRYWLHYGEGSLMPLLVMKLIVSHMSKPPTPILARPMAALVSAGLQRQFLTPQLKLHLDYVEAELGRSQWFAGDALSGADILMSFPLEAASTRAGGNYPRIKAFVERIQARPAYKQALERGGPYQLLG